LKISRWSVTMACRCMAMPWPLRRIDRRRPEFKVGFERASE
jgi:hypothetical protein